MRFIEGLGLILAGFYMGMLMGMPAHPPTCPITHVLLYTELEYSGYEVLDWRMVQQRSLAIDGKNEGRVLEKSLLGGNWEGQ